MGVDTAVVEEPYCRFAECRQNGCNVGEGIKPEERRSQLDGLYGNICPSYDGWRINPVALKKFKDKFSECRRRGCFVFMEFDLLNSGL